MVYTIMGRRKSKCPTDRLMCCAESRSSVWLFASPWTAACQAPQSMEFSRKEYWSGLPCPTPGDLSNPRMEPRSPTLQADYLPAKLPGKSIERLTDTVISGFPIKKTRPFIDHLTVTYTNCYFLEQKISSFSAILFIFSKNTMIQYYVIIIVTILMRLKLSKHLGTVIVCTV